MNEQDHASINIPERPVGTPHFFMWIQRRRWILVSGGLTALLLAVQWPIFKEIAYSAIGVPAPKDGIAWRTDYAAALAESAKEGKPVLLDFYADWCPPCQAMKRESWPDEHVRQLVTQGFIPVAANVDADGIRGVAARYQVDSIPRIIIVDAEGRALKTGTFMFRDELVEFLKNKPAAKQLESATHQVPREREWR